MFNFRLRASKAVVASQRANAPYTSSKEPFEKPFSKFYNRDRLHSANNIGHEWTTKGNRHC